MHPGSALHGRQIGIEHEYVVYRQGRALDFRPLLEVVTEAVAAEASRPSPGLPPGTVVSADEHEAEVALAPIPTSADFASRIDRAARCSRGWLRSTLSTTLGQGVWLEGVSTHLNVSLPDRIVAPVAALIATTFAPALVLLMDRPGSAGILTRAHRGRLELCGDFVAGRHLRASAVFALGAVLVAADAIGAGWPDRLPSLRLETRRVSRNPARWSRVHWTKGAGFLRDGRATAVTRSDGRATTIGVHTADAWLAMRAALIERVRLSDVTCVDRLIEGRDRLPLEADRDSDLDERWSCD